MHEVGIVNGILDTVIRAARGAGASRAVLVTLRIGDMTEVVREALDFAWETFRDEDPLTRGCELAAVPNVAAPTCVCCTAASSTSQVSKSKPPTISPLAIW